MPIDTLKRPSSAQELKQGNPAMHRTHSGGGASASIPKVKQLIDQQRLEGHKDDLIKKLEGHKDDLVNKVKDQGFKGITQPGYATGDQFSIAATLVSNPNTVIFIEKVNPEVSKKDKSKQDKVGQIVEFYTSCGIEPERIAVVDSRGDIARDVDLKHNPERLMNESEVTQYVGENYDRKMQEAIRKAFRVGENHDKVEEWLSKGGITIPNGSPVIILWSRFSGKGGAAHIEHDTSYTGIEQLIKKVPGDYTIVIAGDREPKRNNESNAKYQKMALKSEFSRDKPVIDLTNIWEAEGVGSWAEKRVEQLRIYDYINKRALGNLVHLGSRSGNLEALALVGHDTHYLEENNALGASRMAIWEKNMKGLRYIRTLIENSATRSGKITKAGIDMDRKKQFAAKMRKKFPDLDKKIKKAHDELKTAADAYEPGMDLTTFKPEDKDKEQYKKFESYRAIEQLEKGIKKIKDPEKIKAENEKLSKLKEERDQSSEYKKYKKFLEYEVLEEAISQEKKLDDIIKSNKVKGKKLEQLEKGKKGATDTKEEIIRKLGQAYEKTGDFGEYKKYKVVKAYQKVADHEEIKDTIQRFETSEVTISELIDSELITAQEVEDIIVNPKLLSPAVLQKSKSERSNAKLQAEGAGLKLLGNEIVVSRLDLSKGFTEDELEEISSLLTPKEERERIIRHYYPEGIEEKTKSPATVTES